MIPEEELTQIKTALSFCNYGDYNIAEHKLMIKDTYYINNTDYVECSFELFYKVDLDRSVKAMYNFCKVLCEEKKFTILLDKYIYIRSKYAFYVNFGLFIVYTHLYKTYEDFNLSEYNTYIADTSKVSNSLENIVLITNAESNYYIDSLSKCCDYIRKIATEKFVDDGNILIDIFDFLDSDGNIVMSLPYFCTTNDTSSYDEKVKILQKILLFTHSDNLEILCAAQCKYNVKEYKLIDVWRTRKDN